MIRKPYESTRTTTEPRARAGDDAQRQLAYYLHRAFATTPEIEILHDLRIVDPEQPDQDDKAGVCQIDHLLIHQWGLFIVESKSVTTEVRVRADAAGGDEWTRTWNGKERGIPSPIQQARRQADFLRTFLQRNRRSLLGRFPVGSRALAKIVHGHDQRGFLKAPIQLIIAISDSGRITRTNGWSEPEKPFRVFVTKADLVHEKVSSEVERHRKGASFLSPTTGLTHSYGLWGMEAHEPEAVGKFLVEQHRPQQETPSRRTTTPPRRDEGSSPPEAGTAKCRHCGSQALTGHSGRYGYYWRCSTCSKNTPMLGDCPSCGAAGRRGGDVRVRKDRNRYFRDCAHCGASTLIWTEGTSSPEDRAQHTPRDTSIFTDGAVLVPDFVTPAEEERILYRIGEAPWLTELRRRVQHYGFQYDYQGASRPVPAAPFPPWAATMAERLRSHFSDTAPTQCIVNEYRPGQGIAMHADHRDFGPVVASLSLGAAWPMRFRLRGSTYNKKGQPGDELAMLPRRSLLVLAGGARDRWMHGIDPADTARETDIRVSATFRTVPR